MRRWIAVATFTLLAACALGYDSAPPQTLTTQPSPIDQAASDLATAQALWASFEVTDYTYEFINNCGECDPSRRSPRRIAVLDGRVLVVEDAHELLTVDEVFASIEHALAAGRQVEVTYDQETGLPQDVQIDMDMRPVDGGTHWILTDMTELTPVDSADELRKARKIWDAQDLNHYRFLMKVECDCPEKGTFEVKVVDDRVVEVIALGQKAETGPITPVTMNQTFDDLEEWFTDTQDLIDEGILRVDVRVDPVMGYPRWVAVRANFTNDDSVAPFTVVVTMDLVQPLAVDDSPSVPDADDLAALEQAKGLWQAGGITDYRYTLTVHCNCPEEYAGPFEVTVRDTWIASATWKGEPLGPGQGTAYTIQEVFAIIERAIEEGTDVDITYDPAQGHPVTVIIDVEAVAVDGGLAFSIGNLIPIGKKGGIAGQALAGPTCPVQQDPAAGACADRPVAGANLVILDDEGDEVIRVTTNPDGYFQASLEPGEYHLEPQAVAGLLGTPAPFIVVIEPGITNQVTISYDTGIR